MRMTRWRTAIEWVMACTEINTWNIKYNEIDNNELICYMFLARRIRTMIHSRVQFKDSWSCISRPISVEYLNHIYSLWTDTDNLRWLAQKSRRLVSVLVDYILGVSVPVHSRVGVRDFTIRWLFHLLFNWGSLVIKAPNTVINFTWGNSAIETISLMRS